MMRTELQQAQAALHAGDFAAAGRLFQRLLRGNPRDVPALYGLGLVCLQSERFESAVYVLGELLRLAPDYADAHCIRGVAFVRLGRSREALACFERAVVLAPNSIEAVSNYGTALLQVGEHERALTELDRALSLDPRHVFSWHNRGNALTSLSRLEEAVESYSRALDIDPEFALAAENRDAALLRLRRVDRCPPAFMRKLFDDFSVHYDSTMRYSLDYRAPEILAALTSRLLPAGAGPLRILDLGCGTGLMGEAFARFAKGGPIDGIDLSPKMLEVSRSRGIYRNLVLGDLETELTGSTAQYDLMIAGDSMIYLGDLSRCFSAVAGRLDSPGWFLFNAEAQEGDGWALTPGNRFTHSENYIRSEASRCGLAVAAVEPCVARLEHSQPVAGFAVALHKPSR
jgi:predicted TPR repeat methyltransferase